MELYAYVVFCCALAVNCVETEENNATKTVISVGDTAMTLSFSPSEIKRLVMGNRDNVYVHANLHNLEKVDTGVQPKGSNQGNVISLKAQSENKHIARTDIDDIIQIPLGVDIDKTNNDFFFTLHGHFLGRTHLNIYAKAKYGTVTTYGESQDSKSQIKRQNVTGYTQIYVDIPTTDKVHLADNWQLLDVQYKVAVIREDRAIDRIFLGTILVLLLMANIGMGCKIDLKVVKEVLRRPIAPTIGFCCQFIVMPLLAFSIVMLLKLETGVALGFFAMGCAPGGGASNIYTYLLNGDLSLSITMTMISTFASLGMIPLWLFTLGQHILNEQNYDVTIPYTNILGSLAGIIIPVGIGIVIQLKRPSWSKKIVKLLRPVYIVFLIFMFTFGIYVNQYIFRLFTPILVLAGCLLPWFGFFLGAIVAFITKQPFDRIKTIAIETGIQNSGIPIILMKFSLDQPEADMSLVSPIVVSVFTPVPLLTAILIQEIRKRCCKPKKEFSPISNDSDHAAGDQEENEANSNKIYKGRTANNGEPVFDKEMKTLKSNVEDESV